MRTRTLLRLAARNSRRHRVRTALTAGMVVAGVGLLLVALSWVNGVFGNVLQEAAGLGGHVRLVAPEYAAREELFPLYANLPDVEPLAARLRALPGVAAVEPRIVTGVTVTVSQEIGDVFALAVGGSPAYFAERLKADQKVVAGRWFSGAPGELVVGAKVAEEAHARPGDEVVLLGLTQDGSLSPIKGRLVGIVKTGSLLDRQVLVPLDRLQWLADLPGGATELLVFADRYQRGPALAQALRAVPGLERFTVQAWSEREPLASMTGTIEGVRFFVVCAVVLLAALGIWNTMTTSVLERTREIGVLRAMGMTRAGAVWLFVVEALSIAFVGGVGGVLFGLGPALALQRWGIRIGESTAARLALPISEVIRAQVTPGLVLFAFGLGLLMALVGSVPAALRAASIQPVTAMRSGR